jgi:hypothetical protein
MSNVFRTASESSIEGGPTHKEITTFGIYMPTAFKISELNKYTEE